MASGLDFLVIAQLSHVFSDDECDAQLSHVFSDDECKRLIAALPQMRITLQVPFEDSL